MTQPTAEITPPLRVAIWVSTRIIAPIGLILGGLSVTFALIALRGSAQTRPPSELVIPVTVTEVTLADQPAWIDTTGVVQPAQSVNIIPEVSGRVVWVAPGLVRGATFRRGETLARLDDRDQVAALEAERARLVQSELELQLEQSRQRIAEREWSSLGDTTRPAAEQQLALRRPHLAVAEQAVVSARAAVARAELNVARTRLTAPFDAAVITENLDIGQVVAPGASVATLIGTSALQIEASIPSEQLSAINLPGEAGEPGSAADVVWRLPNREVVRATGHVVRRVAQLDAVTRTGTVVINVSATDFDATELPLLPNALVNVRLQGRAIPNVARVPRAALDGPEHIWVADNEARLARRTVDIAWREQDFVLVRGGLLDGDRVITSPLSMPVAGVRVREAATTAAAPVGEQ